MKSVSASAMRLMDRSTIDSGIKSGTVLMESAGAYAVSEVLRLWGQLSDLPLKVLILAGKGNNGGDGFVMARLLSQAGALVTLVCAGTEDELSADAGEMFRRLPDPVRKRIYYSLKKNELQLSDLIVDAMLGTGCKGELRDPYRNWIRQVNESQKPVIAVDMPSGLDADHGCVTEDCMIADLTVTFQRVKTGMLSEEGIRRCGRIRVCDIGIPQDVQEQVIASLPPEEAGFEVTGMADVRPFFFREDFDTYKNRRGHVMVVGGSRNYPSAPFLSAEAALRTGAGLVSVLLPAHAEVICSVPKSIIVRRVPDDGHGVFNEHSISELSAALVHADSLVIGPGMSTEPESVSVLKYLLGQPLPKIVDADALNLLSAAPELFGLLDSRCILTPHEGEMDRLLNAFSLDSGGTPVDRALALAKATGTTVLLKGPRTVVARDGMACLNLSGCAALATAGSGDVLSGILGCLNFRMTALDAARSGVFLHGLAGELESPLGSRGVIADDLCKTIPLALKQICAVS